VSQLAIRGGSPYRASPFPERTPFGDRELELVTAAIQSQNLFGPSGHFVSDFEERFAGLYGLRHAVASTSGTAAIHVAIGALDLNPGDEIITAPITDGGTIVPILYQNAIPIFADIDHTYNMDPADIERKITGRTRAILVVHLFGNPCDMDATMAIARRHDLPVIEDCSQAHMTEYRGRLLGTIGDIGCFSLQQSKHMTTGDGGMTVTNRDDWAERMRVFADKGWSRQSHWGRRAYLFLGPNYRMTELQAAVGLGQLDKVADVVKRRNELGTRLSQSISDVEGVQPAPVTEGGFHSYWTYPLGTERWSAAEFGPVLAAEGIPCWAGYIGEPIFLCMEALASKMTYGTSQCPFACRWAERDIEYTEDMCPRTMAALRHMVTFTFNENFSDADILDVAGAIRKVATELGHP
jgi:perosamine synthetase